MTDPNYDPNDFSQWSTKTIDGTIVSDEVEGSKLAETPPRIPAPSVSDRFHSLTDRVRKTPTKSSSRARSKPAKPRVSVEKVIGWGWQMLAQMTAPVNLPVARVIDMQAPVAGQILEDIVKGSVVDRVLQPLARASVGGEAIFALIGPPLLIGALSARPQMAPVLIPPLREALRTWMVLAGPKLEEKKKSDTEFMEEYGTTIDAMIYAFLYGEDGPPEENGNTIPGEVINVTEPVTKPPRARKGASVSN